MVRRTKQLSGYLLPFVLARDYYNDTFPLWCGDISGNINSSSYRAMIEAPGFAPEDAATKLPSIYPEADELMER